MALCSYDNELNQKYNINQEIKMTPAQKKAQEAKEAEELRLAEEAKAQEAKELMALQAEAKKYNEVTGEESPEQLREIIAMGELDDKMGSAPLEETDPASNDMNILEAFELAESGKKLVRKGWSKELKTHYVFIKRGETKPSLSNGKHSSPYSPSLPDVMNFDWFDVEEEA